MMLFRRWAVILAAAMWVCGAPAALAAQEDAVFNRQGVWGIDVDGGACAVSRILDDGSTFLFRASDGEVTFGYFQKTAFRAGRTGRLEVGAVGFDFKPALTGDGHALFYNANFAPEVVAALRSAPSLRILIDGRPVLAMKLDGTGFPEALDGVVDCSKGRSGWWGKGVEPEGADPASPPGAANDKPAGDVIDESGTWAMAVAEAPGVCTAYAKADQHLFLLILGAFGREGLAIRSDAPLPAGRTARIETDAEAFDAKVSVDEDGHYMSMDGPLDASALAKLRKAQLIKVSVAGKPVLEAPNRGTAFTDILNAVAACSRGGAGWWGKGAKPPN